MLRSQQKAVNYRKNEGQGKCPGKNRKNKILVKQITPPEANSHNDFF